MKSKIAISLTVLGLLAGCTQPTGSPLSATPISPSTLNVADAAIAGGDPGMALSVSQSILKDEPGNTDALIHEGDAYYALGRCPAAEAAYKLALTHDPKSTDAQTGIGRCLIKTDPKAAEVALLQAVQDDPGNANALNDLGIARDLQGNFAGAVEPYQNALLSQPGMVAAEINLGLSLALSGDGRQAAQYLGPLATGQGATAKTREDYAAALVAQGEIAQARQILSVDLAPDQVNAAIEGFSALMANSQPPLPDDSGASPPAIAPQVQTTGVSAASLMPATPAAAPEVTAPPASTPPASTPLAETTAAAPSTDDDTGSYKVQLGALPSQPAAQHQWDRISGASPALFSDKQPDIQTATVNGKTYYRLRTGSFASKSQAAKFCGEVSAAGNACTLANF